MPSCPHCTVTRAQADLERAQKKLEAEGGADPPAYMRDRAWNVARIQYALTKRRVQRTMRKDWLRQERERIWEAEHQPTFVFHSMVVSVKRRVDKLSTACAIV